MHGGKAEEAEDEEEPATQGELYTSEHASILLDVLLCQLLLL